MIVLWAIIGGALNRLRGAHSFLPRWAKLLLIGGAYALLCVLSGVSYPLAGISGFLLALSMIPGHGEFIGALGGIRGYWHTEDWDGGTYDKVADLAHGKRRMWGYLGLLAKGVVTGIAITPALGWVGIPIGALMPVVYFVGVSLEQVIMKRDGFEWSEILHGAVIFGLTGVALG